MSPPPESSEPPHASHHAITKSGRTFFGRLIAFAFPSKVYPELELARSEFERMEVATRAKNQRLPSLRETWPVSIFIGFVLLTVLAFPRVRPPWMPMWIMPLVIAAAAGLFALVMVNIGREMMRRRIRSLLLERGVPLCLHCGYDLRGLPTAHSEDASTPAATPCPECGHAIDPRAREILAAQPRPAGMS